LPKDLKVAKMKRVEASIYIKDMFLWSLSGSFIAMGVVMIYFKLQGK